MGSGPVTFSGPGRFYIVSAPRMPNCPTRLITIEDAVQVEMGAAETSNERIIYPVHPPGCDAELASWSWATPSSTADRSGTPCPPICMTAGWRPISISTWRLTSARLPLHGRARGDAPYRHAPTKRRVISPPWSIHCGAGTGAYTFCWAMAGDNVDYTDMDMVGDGGSAVNPFSLTVRRALVTGANTGIGQAIAVALGRAGAHVICGGPVRLRRNGGDDRQRRGTAP